MKSKYWGGSTLPLTALACALATPAFAATAPAATDAADAGDGQIIVTGDHIANPVKLKKESAATVEVMSAEEIARQPGGNIVDIISHLPGLTGYSDMGLGQAATGEKEFVTIRGIDASYNSYTMNGIEVPTADFSTRALSLKMIAPYGIANVTVTKTPTADMPGDAIGGVIDIATPSAFDFAKGRLNKITLAGTLSGKAVDMGFPAAGGTAQGEFARTFGTEKQFGIYATAYYDNRSSVGTTLQARSYTPTLESEANVSDWRNLKGGVSLQGLQSDFYRDHIKRYGGNIALDYHGDRQTLYLRGTYGRYENSATDSQHGLFSIATGYDASGSFVPVGLLSSGYFQTRDQTTSLASVQAGGATRFSDRLTLTYDLSVGRSTWARPNYVEGSLYGQYIVDGSANFDAANPAAPTVAYTNATARNYASNADNTALWKFQGSDSGASNMLYAGKVGAEYKVGNGWLDSVKAGARVSISKRYEYQHQFMGNNGDNFVIKDAAGHVVAYTNPQGPTVSQLAGTAITDAYGLAWKSFDRSTFVNGIVPYKYTSQYGLDPDTGQVTGNPGVYTVNDYLRNSVYGTESTYAAYVQANLHLGPVQAVAGLRYEYTDFKATQWQVLTTDTGGWVKSGNTYGELLPSLNLVWRPDQQLVVRASAHRGFSRPAFGLIAGPETVTIDDISGTRYISRSNPNLKATTSNNFDLGVEWYGHDGSFLTVATYYKALQNYIFTASATGSLPNSASGTLGDVTMPENGTSAHLYGIELSANHKLKELPGLLSGFGIGANATFQHSSADAGAAYDNRKTWLPRAPEQMYNVNVSYEHGPFNTMLTWQRTGLQLLSLTSNNLDQYLQPSSTLDLNVGLNLGHVTFGLQVQNLLDKAQFWKTMGKGTQYLGTQDGGGNGSYVQTGRFFKLTASYQW
ncbi:TonB-dependent receptor [Novosphingobium rosa]|uniref:TonB-dependent receptor n=1 Tax=Novosphingobium rosa TaxID=76978 RepID=UPI0008303CEB|nr:TonB-dependent receptor [Novosphingobium rosa]